jgi:hypothetical protein
LLQQRFAEFGAEGVRFFDELLRARRNGKDEAARVLGLILRTAPKVYRIGW